MTEVPKIVHQRLRAGLRPPDTPERVHPDADLLTAFAERALPLAERDGVLEHLALCGDCREVVTLALPDAGVSATPDTGDAETTPATVTRTRVYARHGRIFAWPRLRWAVLAAGVAVVAAVLLVRPGKPPFSDQRIASLSMPSTAAPSPIISLNAAATNTDTPDKKSNLTLSKKLAAPQPVPTPQTESEMLLADNKNHTRLAGNRPAEPSARSSLGAPTRQGMNKTAGVGGTAETVTVAPSEDTLMAQSDAPAINGRLMDNAPVEKAKPATPETEAAELKETQATPTNDSAQLQMRSMTSTMMAASSARPFPSATWAIKAGVLQRSLDQGQSWQNALHADHPLLCYAARGMDVWAGGAAGTLFHSADGGKTWLQVQPSFESRPLAADVTHIDLPDDARHKGVQSYGLPEAPIALSTSNNEMWSSIDGGKNWTKRAVEKK